MKTISKLFQMALSKPMVGHTQQSSTDFQMRNEEGKGWDFLLMTEIFKWIC